MDNINNTDPVGEAKTTPSAEEMLQRLKAVDLGQFDINSITDQLKGKRIWIPILVVPISAVILALFTLLGAFLFDQPILSFVVTASLLYWIGKELERSQEVFVLKARQEVVNRIADIEEGFGLLPHFQVFLPERYRHLWQSVRKGHYIYIEQYLQAIALLQDKLEAERFIKVWHISHPETDPEKVAALAEESDTVEENS
ncbi:MAG: hypothetical protein ISEC1_P1646 [Thiomicrorhabdus sp.]|nr:MAG: hypothetical protein ISEC1_P1646 [Thiomicrorhabdus sp.]